jgi:deoxyribonuclease V
MKFPPHHAWDVTPAEARALQRELAPRVSLIDAIDPAAVRVAVGVDNGYVKTEAGYVAYAAAVAVVLPDLEVLEVAYGSAPVTFPYVPGLLSFREAPAILAALEAVRAEPDVFLFDGQGYAHPRRFGLASHLGVVLERPAIGCAKSRLVGEFVEPADEVGAWSPLVAGGETVGAALRTRLGHDPLFVSPGHMISVETAVAIVRACCRDGAFLPVPTGAAHDAVTAYTKPLRGKRR